MSETATKNYIIQIAGSKIDFPSSLLEKRKLIYLAENYDFISDPENYQIFRNGQFNRKYRKSIFILGKDALLLRAFPKILEQFPAYRVIYDRAAQLAPQQLAILEKLFASPLDLVITEKENDSEVKLQLFDKILDLSSEQVGYKLNMEYFQLKAAFNGQAIKKGNSHIELIGNFGSEMREIASWRFHPYGIGPNKKLSFMPEVARCAGNILLEFRIYLIDENNHQIARVIKGSPEAFMNLQKIIENDSDSYRAIALSLYAQGGEGRIEIGQVHFRNYLSDQSFMITGGKRIIDSEVRNEELFYYFNPGDLKPPLAVYFSGYRTAEGFEGLGMMSKMDCPFLLIADSRLEGGNFYLGSPTLERKLVKIIQEKLTWLGFSNQDLILSGLSMGTFAALYYASDLQPASVIVGKPLANIGSIAINERIQRPEIWGTSLDMLSHFSGKAGLSQARALNQRFWDKFNQGDFNQTSFALSYMKDDDYDGEAFQMIDKSLKKHSPRAAVIYKSFVGRHNDNSAGINSWFIKQYRNILWSKYQREIDYHL